MIRKWRAVKRPLLRKEHAAKRLQWAMMHQYKTREDWARIAWSDESAIQKDSARQQVWVFRHQNRQEKYALKNVRGKARDGDVSQMIWGCFVSNKLGPIAFIDGTVNSDVYIDILLNNFLPYLNALTEDGIVGVTFQQDNARPHTSKKTRAFFDTTTIEHGFLVMEWPPNSPDMNLIENLWAHLKVELHCRYPDTATLRGPPHYIRRLLRERLTEVWWSIGEGVLDGLIDSMPHHVQALIEAKGWYTEF